MTPSRPRSEAPADWEIQENVDWVDNAFGGVEAEIASWRPLYWIRQALTGVGQAPLAMRLRRS
ncbi:MAG: hypothetical protein RIB45_06195 [Marivibrio sp.]|uniref:hypothetical protein n=1 Tax=Marivibrio sp. TaxID=2039719 RepID=UPI0032EBB868